ncbi:hypothetical protein D3C79_811250 [compost metagenome]
MGLVRAVIGVLPQDHHLDLIQLGQLEGIEHLGGGGIDHLTRFPLLPDGRQGCLEIVLLFLRANHVSPGHHTTLLNQYNEPRSASPPFRSDASVLAGTSNSCARGNEGPRIGAKAIGRNRGSAINPGTEPLTSALPPLRPSDKTMLWSFIYSFYRYLWRHAGPHIQAGSGFSPRLVGWARIPET